MRFFVVLALTLLTWNTQATHLIPSDPTDAGVQIPPVGSSLFDKMFSDQFGTESKYVVPYPIDSLLKRATIHHGNFVHSLFPFSRSLQRPVDLRYDPLLNPRLVLAAADGIAQNKLFIGYVKAVDQLEVISFNDEAGRFEFQIVENYSHNPRVYYADRGLCLSCHQGQSPIFSIGPWRDTSLGAMDEMIGAKLGLPLADRSNSRLLSSRLFGAISSTSNSAILDSIVRSSNSIAVDGRIWVHGCGTSKECRLGLLLNTLTPHFERTREFSRIAEKILRSSGIENQTVFNSLLSSTDLGIGEIVRREAIDGRQDLDSVAHSNSLLLEIIANIYRLEPKDNPATLRPQMLGPITVHRTRLADFVPADMDALYSDGRTAEQIGQNLLNLYEKESELFQGGPMNKPLIMHSLLKALGSARAQDYSMWLNRQTPPKLFHPGTAQPIFKVKELNVLSRHCATCHAGTSRFPPQFLHGSEAQVLKNIAALKHRLIYKIENNLMPPTAERREIFTGSGDRAMILEYLRNL